MQKSEHMKKARSAHETRIIGLMAGVTIGDSCPKVPAGMQG